MMISLYGLLYELSGCFVIALPDSAEAFRDATWQDVAPYYEELANRPLDRTNVEVWLADWSQFESLLSEAASLANFAYACNTADMRLEAARLRFSSEIDPQADEQRTRLQRRLTELGYARPGLETMGRRREDAAPDGSLPGEQRPERPRARLSLDVQALHRAARHAGRLLRPHVRPSPAGREARGLRQLSRLCAPREEPLRLHAR